jgi:hypothetical protein
VRSAIAAKLAGISGVEAHDVWPKEIGKLPAAIVLPKSAHYGDEMSGDGYTITLDVLFYAATAGDFERGSRALDAYLDPTGEQSIVAALEDGQTSVTGWTDYGVLTFNDLPLIGCRLTVEVYA